MRTPSVLPPSTSAGDLAISRRSSGDALDALRRRQAEAAAQAAADRRDAARREADARRDDADDSYARPRTPDVPRRRNRDVTDEDTAPSWPVPRRRQRDDDGYSGGYSGGTGGGYGNEPAPPPRRTPPVRPRWAGDPGWQAPAWVDPGVDAGTWNPVFLWYLLDTLSRPGHAEWFSRHRDDAGYASWRRAADRAAASNPGLSGELSALDRGLAAAPDAPRDPGYLPPGVSRDEAEASDALGTFLRLLLVIAVIGAVGGAGFWAFRRLSRGGRTMGKPGIRDVAAAAEGAVRNKLGKPAEAPPRDPFRLGQTLTVDPSYFILAAGSLRQPEPPGSLSVTAIGTFDGVPLTRLLFPGDRFALVHLSDAGHVDECRLYQPHDTVQPEGEDGWAFWLPPGAPPEGGGPSEWAIGFPVFETKDGTRWDRVWSPGEDQVEPVEATETVKGLDGTSGRRVSMMLYARDTGAKAPAPVREYLLLSAVRDGAGAEVRIHLGIDVDATPIQPIA